MMVDTTTVGGSLPQVPFGPHQVSRLIIGGNPFRGNSHVSQELSADMEAWFTQEQIVRTLFECERQGLTAMQSRGDHIIMDMVRAYRRQGGTLQWIVQTASEMPDVIENIREIAALDPIAIYHHGSNSDLHFRQGTMQTVLDRIKLIKDLGLMAGFASHIPEAFYLVEEQGWPIDFYMACFYNLAKTERDSKFTGGELEVCQERFDDEDRDVICRFIQQTKKPCLGFKILAASRNATTPERLRAAFQYAFDNIKPTDAVVVGMFTKYLDQVRMNADLVREMG